MSVFQEGRGSVQVFLRNCGGTRTNIKVNGYIWRKSIVRTLWSTWLSGLGFEQCMRIRVPLPVHLYLLLTEMKTERFGGTKHRGITSTASTCGI